MKNLEAFYTCSSIRHEFAYFLSRDNYLSGEVSDPVASETEKAIRVACLTRDVRTYIHTARQG